ncbi:MAG: hypothetical protein VST70_00185, partial [Nitrospirota bacterium]|nr:hypothetical protein [Nitrospirota bacterium]
MLDINLADQGPSGVTVLPGLTENLWCDPFFIMDKMFIGLALPGEVLSGGTNPFRDFLLFLFKIPDGVPVGLNHISGRQNLPREDRRVGRGNRRTGQSLEFLKSGIEFRFGGP